MRLAPRARVATLNAPEQGERTMFGDQVDIDGDIIVVGEPRATVDDHLRAGRAHIFDTSWNHLAMLQSPIPTIIYAPRNTAFLTTAFARIRWMSLLFGFFGARLVICYH